MVLTRKFNKGAIVKNQITGKVGVIRNWYGRLYVVDYDGPFGPALTREEDLELHVIPDSPVFESLKSLLEDLQSKTRKLSKKLDVDYDTLLPLVKTIQDKYPSTDVMVFKSLDDIKGFISKMREEDKSKLEQEYEERKKEFMAKGADLVWSDDEFDAFHVKTSEASCDIAQMDTPWCIARPNSPYWHGSYGDYDKYYLVRRVMDKKDNRGNYIAVLVDKNKKVHSIWNQRNDEVHDIDSENYLMGSSSDSVISFLDEIGFKYETYEDRLTRLEEEREEEMTQDFLQSNLAEIVLEKFQERKPEYRRHIESFMQDPTAMDKFQDKMKSLLAPEFRQAAWEIIGYYGLDDAGLSATEFINFMFELKSDGYPYDGLRGEWKDIQTRVVEIIYKTVLNFEDDKRQLQFKFMKDIPRNFSLEDKEYIKSLLG